MCGRYSIGNEIQELASEYKLKVPDNFRASYNAAPGQDLPVLSNQSTRAFTLCQWGIVPFWAKESSKRLINARAETVGEKATFKMSFQKRRCLVPADGYYEWMKGPEGKIPYRICRTDTPAFFLAGIWDTEEDGNTDFAIITTEASHSVAHIHERMPVILADEAVSFWLSDTGDYEGLLDILRPFPDDLLRAYPVSKAVNRVGNNEAALREEVS
jgi:putative SOS response-associated peptidase YedK